MSDGDKFLFVGGVFHGTFQPVAAGVSVVYMDEFPLMAYHRTYANTGGSMDPDWWMRNLSQPTSTVVFEWHEREWVSPAVQAIREAIGGRTAGRPADEPKP